VQSPIQQRIWFADLKSRAFEKLRRTTISFVMSVYLSVYPFAWNNPASTGLIYEIWLTIFHKPVH